MTRRHQSLLPLEGNDDRRDQRVAAAMRMVERFLYDLGLLLAGAREGLEEYVEPGAVMALREALIPFTGNQPLFHPDFGEYADVTIQGDLLDDGAPVTARVEFEDRSTRESPDGTVTPSQRRRVRATLLLDPSLRRVVGQRFDAAS